MGKHPVASEAESPGKGPGTLFSPPPRRYWNSVRGILILLLLIATVPTLLAEIAMYGTSLEEFRQREYQSNLEVARAVAATFDTYVEDVLRQEQALGFALTMLEPFSVEQANRLLKQSAEDYPAIRNLVWMSPTGEIIAASLLEAVGQSLGDRAYFQEIVSGQPWAVSDLLVGRFVGEISFAIARGVYDRDGKLVGVMVAAMEPRELGTVLAVPRRGEGAIAIIDRQGYGVYRYPEVEMTWEQRNWLGSQPILQSALKSALTGQEATGTFVSTIDGQERMTALAPIGSLGWAASANRPVGEVMAPKRAEILRDLGILLLFALLACSAALLGSRRLTVPIARLREHAMAIARGDLVQRVQVAGGSELQDLAEAFNRMAEEVRVREEKAAQLLEAEALACYQAETTQRQITSILESIGDAFVAVDSQWRFTYVNEEAERLLRRKREELIGKDIMDEWPGTPESIFFRAFHDASTGQRAQEVEGYSRILDRWIEASVYPAPVGISVYFRDTTQRKQAQEALRESEERFRSAFEHAPIGVALAGLDGRFQQVNRALCDMLGYSELELLARTFQEITHPEDLAADLAQVERLMKGEIQVFHLEKRYLHKEGHAVWALLSATVVRDSQGQPLHFLAQMQDITEVKRAEDERQRTQMALQEFALVDDLTGLYNRRGFVTLAQQQLKLAVRNGQELTIFFFDMDGLKKINDSFGHQEGDRALAGMGRVLKETFRTSDIVARLGGDEFGALVVKGSGCISSIEKRLSDMLKLSNAETERPCPLSFSMGTAVYDPGSPRPLDELMCLADRRMYEQKSAKWAGPSPVDSD